MNRKTKQIIIINSMMLIIAFYTFVSIYKPSLLSFMNSNYVDGEYVRSGGDHLTDELFLYLVHYINLFTFYIINIIIVFRSYKKKYFKNMIIAIISIILMIFLKILVKGVNFNNKIQGEEYMSSVF